MWNLLYVETLLLQQLICGTLNSKIASLGETFPLSLTYTRNPPDWVRLYCVFFQR